METKVYCSQEQKSKLTELVLADSQLNKGKFSNSFTFKESERRWKEISEILNAIPGASKDWKQWRKTWQDMRSKAKAKKAKENNYMRGTGGGPPVELLSQSERLIIEQMNPQLLEGNSNVEESFTNFMFPGSSCEIDVVVDDHNYNIREVPSPAATSTPQVPAAERRRLSKADRLTTSAIASTALAEISKQDVEIRKNYYDRQLALLERLVVTVEEIARKS